MLCRSTTDHARVIEFVVEQVLVMEADMEVRAARSVRHRVVAGNAEAAIRAFVAQLRGDLVGSSSDSTNERASAIIQVGDRIYRVYTFRA